jgi:hypothetical protein
VNRVALSTLLLAAVAPLPAQAPDGEARAQYTHQSDAPQAVAARLTETIRIDGSLDEPAWQSAPVIAGFRQLDPDEGAPVSERTEIRVLYDDDALYIGAWLYDRHRVSARLGRRDGGMSASDWLTVIIDSNHDHRSAFGFEINPAGTRRDQTRDGGSEDDSWDPVWESAAVVTDSGWFAELRIPFSQLRFTGAVDQTWGLQIERQIARRQEFAVWSFTPRDQPAGIPRYGHLTGLTRLATGKRLEVMPYVVARAEHVDRGNNPFRSTREYNGDAGLDLKYRVSSNLTLDGTINPDFGQVEVDPAVINLTAFETFFPEKRPFFIEGAQLFRFGQDGTNSVFYSRRIGRQPTLAPPYAARDVPEATRILGAAKLTGRSAGGWAMGLLNATTQREIARFHTPTGELGETVAEPLTNYFVGRLRREGRGGQSEVGGFVGAVNRDLSGDELPRLLRSAAYSGGVDFTHQWDQRTWTLRGYVAGSHVRGDSAVMLATQRLPYHYFQRPDAGHLDLDPGRTSLSGGAAFVSVAKRVGRHWNGSASVNTITPGYEVSDLGFQRRADRTDLQTSLNYQETRPGRIFRRYSVSASPLVEFNYGGENVSNRVFVNAFGQFLNYWSLSFNAGSSLAGTVDDRLTRGGPAARRPGSVYLSTYASSDSRRRIVGEVFSFVQAGPGDGSNTNIGAYLALRPQPHWDVAVGPSYSRDISEAQHVRRVADPSATHTFGARYVFASLDQSTLAVETRLNYTFSPTLSLQVFAQPLLASGAFGELKEFARPGTFDFLVYGRDIGEVEDDLVYPSGRHEGAVSFPLPRQDFNIRSLRGNAVLRWEWRPGSTLYLAWQQTRSGFLPTGDFDLRRDAGAIFATSPDNVLLVKVSYWLNP